MQLRRIRAGRLAAAAAAGAVLSLAVTSTALAHAEIEVDPAEAGATDALVVVFPESHNHDAGAVSVQVYPPEGITPQDITLVSGPAGWEMTLDEDSYTLAGEELEIDASPEHEIRVRQLPDEPVIYFRILLNYSDGQVDRYIEIPTEDNPDPPHAAPGAELAQAAPPEPAAPTTEPAAEPSPEVIAEEADDGGVNTALIITLVVVGLGAAGAGTALLIRRNRAQG